MSEVSSWSATDASNNLTPPDGWPEGMQPSGVNNVGRMMMGAIARWYATVSAGIANALPLSGGTLTGPLVVPGATVTGTLNAGAVGVATNLVVSGNATINGTTNTGALGVASNLSVSGDITAAQVIANHLYANGNIDATGNINAVSGTITAVNLTATGTLNTATLGVSGNATVIGTLNAAELGANVISATAYRLSGATFATRGSDGAGPFTSIFDAGGQPAIDMYGANGTYYRCDNAHSFTNRAATFNICRFQATDGNCINSSGLWNVVSDGAVKENVAPYRAGLAEVLQLEPVSYRYTDDAPFGADGQLRYGLVAQDVEPILPEMITHAALSRAGSDETTDFATMAPGHLVFVLTNAVKELAAQNAQLSARLATLEGDRHV